MENKKNSIDLVHLAKLSMLDETECSPDRGWKHRLTSLQLFRHFKTLSKIKSASVEQLSEVVGKSRAEKIYNHFANEN